ncbi:MAG: GLUG motif-containing protein [Planctomycetota bacterium]|jgi:hypothetical protein
MSEIRNSSLLGKITVLVVICCLVVGSLFVSTTFALDGSGTEGDPWLIKSLEDFNDFAADANYWAGFTRLETDVNLAGMVYDRTVIAWDVNNANNDFDGTGFTGIFDGNDHRIMNMTIDDGGASDDYLGLFGCIEGGHVSNLGIEGSSISGYDYVGLVVLNYGIISNCYFTGETSGFRFVGGLIGYNYGSVSSCYSTGDVRGPGGIVGGLVGSNYGNVSNCYAASDVNGVLIVGGLVGKLYDDCSVSNCFWDTGTQTHGVTLSIGHYTGGTVTNVSGLTTAKMQTKSTFTDAGWDFINIWNIGENQTYPYLRTFLAGDINKDGIVNFLDIAITANQWIQEQ